MRFIDKNYIDEAIEATKTERVITKFLWFPVKIENETRWLETVSIKQTKIQYVEDWARHWGWVDSNFIDWSN
jgi:hypothetical protein